MLRTRLCISAITALMALPSSASAWGACHVGYTHVGPGGAYHCGWTGGAGFHGGFSTGLAGVYGYGGGAYHAGYGYGGAYRTAYYGGVAPYYGGAYYGGTYPAGYGYGGTGFAVAGIHAGGYYGGFHAGVYRPW
jgi:hypothetical protein